MHSNYVQNGSLTPVLIKQQPKKILFANFPADGHFNPLTGLAMQLKDMGFEIAWYTSDTYKQKLAKLQVKHYPFKNAVDVSNNDFDNTFPGRQKYKTQVGKLKFDIIHAFILRAPEYYADMMDIHKEFPFDLLIADVAFTGIPFVKELMKIPVISVGVFPLSENSRDLPPSGLGITPSGSVAGRLMQSVMRKLANSIIFSKPNKVMYALFDRFGIPHNHENLFDMMIRKSDLLLQSGTPGFEYTRSDMSKNIRFIGPLLPCTAGTRAAVWYDPRLDKYERIVLVTQGTVEKDIEKILVPTLQAFANTDVLVVATTGGNNTAELRARFTADNFIIEDFIPFADVMPYADVYVTNGGYGGVLLGIENKLPLVVAGVHEGKNEINARVGYFKLGINLKTEKPRPEQLRNAIETVFSNNEYRRNVLKLEKEFAQYDTKRLFSQYLNEVLYPGTAKIKTAIQQIPVN